MGTVVNFTGVTTLDMPPERVLEAATKAGLTAVMVIGYDKENIEYFASSMADGGDALWLLERFKKQLME